MSRLTACFALLTLLGLPRPAQPLRGVFRSRGRVSWTRAAKAAGEEEDVGKKAAPEATDDDAYVNLWNDDEDDNFFGDLDLSDLAVGDESEDAENLPLLAASQAELAELESLEDLAGRFRELRRAGVSVMDITEELGLETTERLLEAEAADEVDDEALGALGPGGSAFQQTSSNEDLLRNDLLGTAPSHTLVDLDEDGEPMLARFVYVDEYTCIGCTHCASHAPQTFFMEDGFGRARVFQQGGDADSTVATAVSLCPVDCIHYVGWDELQNLETEREGFTEINFKGRLVGSSDIGAGLQDISGNRSRRCNSCPTNGCYDCPMYGVGFNPDYIEKRKQMARRKAEKKVRALRELSGDENLGSSSVDL